MRTLVWLLAALAVLLGVAAIVVALVALPSWVVDGQSGLSAEQELAAKHDVRSEVIQMLGGLAALGGILFAVRQYRQAKIAQATETYRGAVELAGSFDLELCLGGIFALERLARTSGGLRGDVERFFAEYLRHYYPWPIKARERQIGGRQLGDRPTADQTAIVAAIEARESVIWKLVETARTQESPIWRIVRRRSEFFVTLAARRSAPHHNLSKINFTRCPFGRADLRGARLNGCHLGGAIMSEVLVDANTKWTGARYDDTTDWPGQLQPDGVILDPDLAKMRALFADD